MKKETKFEDALNRLETIVGKLESGETELDESLKLFEEGSELVKFCSLKLEEVKRKIEILTKKGDRMTAEPFEEMEEKKEKKTREKSSNDNELAF